MIYQSVQELESELLEESSCPPSSLITKHAANLYNQNRVQSTDKVRRNSEVTDGLPTREWEMVAISI